MRKCEICEEVYIRGWRGVCHFSAPMVYPELVRNHPLRDEAVGRAGVLSVLDLLDFGLDVMVAFTSEDSERKDLNVFKFDSA